MSSYLSNLLTHTTSRYNSIRRTLLNNEDDGDTEDDSHISRVLRAYYTEKGRPFPPWLPPDPNDRRAITPQPYAQQSSGYFTSAGGKSQYSGVQQQGGQRGSLSDLWDAPSTTSAPAQPQSLRAGRRAPGGARPEPSSTLAPPTARPLPSQRAGSHQNIQPQQQRPAMDPSPPASSGSGTAQDRLKARLGFSGRAGSPASSMLSSGSAQSPGYAGTQNPYDQPTTSANAPWSSGGNPYDQGGGGGSSSRRYGRIT